MVTTRSRSAFNIKRLMPRRRSENVDAGHDPSSYFEMHTGVRGVQQYGRWRTQSQKVKASDRIIDPKSVYVVRHSEGFHRMGEVSLVPRKHTPRSSQSSWSSIESGSSTSPAAHRLRSAVSRLATPATKAGWQSRIVSHRGDGPGRVAAAGSRPDETMLLPRTRRGAILTPIRTSPTPLPSLSSPLHSELKVRPATAGEDGVQVQETDLKTLPKQQTYQRSRFEHTCSESEVELFSRETAEAFRLGTPLTEAHLTECCRPGPRGSVGRSSLRSALTRKAVIARPASVQKPARQTSCKSKRPRRRTRPIIKHGWTENARELFPIRMFQRIEADEVLSPEVLNQIRMSRTRPAVETGAPAATEPETPLEPFHVENRLSRMGAAGLGTVAMESSVGTAIGAPRSESPTLDAQRQSQDLQQHEPPPRPVTPPRFSSRRKRSPKPHSKFVSRMPVIPESQTPAPGLARPDLSCSQTEHHIFLPSTTYTSLAPGFQHNRIRLPKKDLVVPAAPAVDDKVDWVPFQMAILGGAGDFLDEATDFGHANDKDTETLEELVSWFDAFGFEGMGELVTEETEGTTTPKARGRDSAIVPVDVEESTVARDANARARDPRGIQESLPPSPMMELMVSADVGANEYMVPMGFNLSHDLGDFLRWESEHGYSGPQGL